MTRDRNRPCTNCKRFVKDHFTNVTSYPLCDDISGSNGKISSFQFIPMENLEYLEWLVSK